MSPLSKAYFGSFLKGVCHHLQRTYTQPKQNIEKQNYPPKTMVPVLYVFGAYHVDILYIYIDR